jgi:hypothetical protein
VTKEEQEKLLIKFASIEEELTAMVEDRRSQGRMIIRWSKILGLALLIFTIWGNGLTSAKLWLQELVKQ